MIHRCDSDDEWVIVDNVRDPANVTKHYVSMDYPDAERTTGTQVELDFVANGFKLRVSHGRCNADGGPYIYIAMAEEPFQGITGVDRAQARAG
jgi:hypothetical protein